MTRDKALAAIKRLAADRSKLRFTKHALERNPMKGKHPISERQADQCLQNGFLTEDPTPDIKLAEGWKFSCERKMEEATIVVAGVLVPGRMILLITGYEILPLRRKQRPMPGDDWDDDGDEE